jgi:ribosomal protein L10
MPAKARSTRTKDEVVSKKSDYILKVVQCLEEYPRFLVVTCDFIGSKHMQQIRLSLRQSGSILLMGKKYFNEKSYKNQTRRTP